MVILEEKEVEETEHVPDRPDHVEEDGHVPEDGQNYHEPRPPFTGTIWNGRINAFVRLDQQNRRRPGGTRPQGYIGVESILGYRRERVHARRPRRTRGASTRWSATTNDLMELARTCSLDKKCQM